MHFFVKPFNLKLLFFLFKESANFQFLGHIDTHLNDGWLNNIIPNKEEVISDVSFKTQWGPVFQGRSAAVQSRNGIIYLFRDGRHAAADWIMLERNQVFCDTRSEEDCIIVLAIKRGGCAERRGRNALTYGTHCWFCAVSEPYAVAAADTPNLDSAGHYRDCRDRWKTRFSPRKGFLERQQNHNNEPFIAPCELSARLRWINERGGRLVEAWERIAPGVQLMGGRTAGDTRMWLIA